MIIEQIWTGNRARNFNYLIACDDTREALAIDPVDHKRCLARASERGWTISQIVNTHEHHDHIAGNSAMVEQTGARILAHEQAGDKIGQIDQGLNDGDVIKVGNSVELIALDTPGHTMCHISLFVASDPPALFSGDTLFNAGVGNCRNGGDPETLFQTMETKIKGLADDTRVYPGHEYLINNLGFSVDREPDNQRAVALLKELRDGYHPDHPLVTTMELEREINPFLRLNSRTIRDRLLESFPDLPQDPSPKQVFLKLRQLRDDWQAI